MIRILFFGLLLLNLTSCSNENKNPFIGAWEVNEIHWITPDTTYNIENAQPSIFMVSDSSYSFIWTPINEKRTPFVKLANPTKDEMISGFRSIVFNAGSYIKTDTTFLIKARIAKVPGFEGGRQTFNYKINNDILELKMIDETYPDGTKPDWFGKLETKFIMRRII